MALASLNSPPGSSKSRPGGRTQRLTEQIFEATVRLLEDKGYGALTFQDVAEVSGVARSTIYRRWTSRAELALDAIGAAVRSNVHMPDTGSLEGDLRATLTDIASFITSRLGSTVLAAGIEIRQTSDYSSSGERWARRSHDVAAIFERALARGELPADFDWEMAFAKASGSLYFRALVTGQPVDQAWIDRVVADFMKTMTATKAGA